MISRVTQGTGMLVLIEVNDGKRLYFQRKLLEKLKLIHCQLYPFWGWSLVYHKLWHTDLLKFLILCVSSWRSALNFSWLCKCVSCSSRYCLLRRFLNWISIWSSSRRLSAYCLSFRWTFNWPCVMEVYSDREQNRTSWWGEDKLTCLLGKR